MSGEGPLVVSDLAVARGGVDVLHGVSLAVGPGAVVTLLGPNGAGKSTLALTLAGVLRASAGKASLGGLPLLGKSPQRIRRSGLAVVPEGHRVLGDLSVIENLRVAAAAVGRRGSAAAIDRVMETFPELDPLLKREAKLLSGGQQQILALAQALVAGPRFLVIDELSLGLAPTVVRRLAEVVPQIAAAGAGVLLIEQFTELALSLSSSAYVLSNGRISLHGTSEELRRSPDLLHSSYLAADIELSAPRAGGRANG